MDSYWTEDDRRVMDTLFPEPARLAVRQCPGCESYQPGTHSQEDGSFLCDYHNQQVLDFPYRAPEV